MRRNQSRFRNIMSEFAVRSEDEPDIVQHKKAWQKVIRLVHESPDSESLVRNIQSLSAAVSELMNSGGQYFTKGTPNTSDQERKREKAKDAVRPVGQHDLDGLWFCIDDGEFTADSGARTRIIHLSGNNHCVLCDFQIKEENDSYVVTAVHDFQTSKFIAGLYLERSHEFDLPATYEVTIGNVTTLLAWRSEFNDEDVLMLSSADQLSADAAPLDAYAKSIYFRSQRPEFALLPLALYFLSTEHYPLVIELTTQVLELDGTSWDAYNLRALANDYLGRFDSAISDSNVALKLVSGDETVPEEERAFVRSTKALAICNRGHANKSRGDVEKAIADYNRAIDEDPLLSVAYMRRAWLRATSWNDSVRDPGAAIADAEKAIELESEENAVFVSVLAAAKASNDDFESAITLQKDAIRLDSEDPELTEMLQCFESHHPWIDVAPE